MKENSKMKYRCVKGFDLGRYDEEGNETDERLVIEEGSIWEVNEKANLLGGEVHLTNPSQLQWLELSTEALENYFEKVETETTQKE